MQNGNKTIDPMKLIIENLARIENLLFQFTKQIEKKAQPIAAAKIHKSPNVKFKLNRFDKDPLKITKATPKKLVKIPMS